MDGTRALRDDFLSLLACPKDCSPLANAGSRKLRCSHGHEFPVVGGVPVLLRDDREQTMELAHRSMSAAREHVAGPNERDVTGELFLDSLGASEEEKETARRLAATPQAIDPVVSVIIAATSGYGYKHLVGKLESYPIPDIRLEDGKGGRLLDMGCNWGRWSIAATGKGYRVVGLDPSLSALMAARRAACQLGLEIDYVCGDARSLPFRDDSFDVVYSHSVIQHFSKDDAGAALDEGARVLKSGGRVLIQMAHAIGVRSLYHQAKRGFSAGEKFDVRYWFIPELKRAFAKRFSSPEVSVHCYFGLGLEPSDLPILPPRIARAVRLSERIRSWSKRIPALKYLADSVYVAARGRDA